MNPSPEEVLSQLEGHGGSTDTWLAAALRAKYPHHVNLQPYQVLRVLKSLEHQGKIRKMKSSSSTQEGWKVK